MVNVSEQTRLLGLVTLAIRCARALFGRLWALLLLIILWQIYVTTTGVNSIVLPGPLDVLRSIAHDWYLYLSELRKTLLMALAGLFLGSLVGTAAAVLTWLSPIAQGALLTGITIVRAIPLVVFVPVLASLLGYNAPMVITVIVVISFFPSFVLVSSGLASLPATARELGDAFGASSIRRLRYIALPSAVPKLFASIRLSSSNAILGAMVTEFLTGVDGLGKLFLVAQGELNSELAIGAAVVGGAAALLLFQFAEWLEARAYARLT